jgi:hypothetical protein
MPNNDANWTTVSGKTKAKTGPTSTKSTAAPIIPKVEVKSILFIYIYKYLLKIIFIFSN